MYDQNKAYYDYGIENVFFEDRYIPECIINQIYTYHCISAYDILSWLIFPINHEHVCMNLIAYVPEDIDGIICHREMGYHDYHIKLTDIGKIHEKEYLKKLRKIEES